MKKSDFVEMLAKDISGHVISHIQVAYPEVWQQIKTSPKKSIKGCLHNALFFHLNQLEFTSKDIEP
jgi:hypothetical protein